MSQLTTQAELKKKIPIQRTVSKNKGCISKQQNLILHPALISSLLDLLLRWVLVVVTRCTIITWRTLCRAPLFDGLHVQFLLLLLYYLSRHHLQDEAATIPCRRAHLEYQEHHVHPVGQEYRDGQGHCCHCEQRLEQYVHGLPVSVTQQATQPPPDVVRFLCFLWEFPDK